MVLPRVKKEILENGVCKLPLEFNFKCDEFYDKASRLFTYFIEGIKISKKEDCFFNFIKSSSFKSEEYDLADIKNLVLLNFCY